MSSQTEQSGPEPMPPRSSELHLELLRALGRLEGHVVANRQATADGLTGLGISMDRRLADLGTSMDRRLKDVRESIRDVKVDLSRRIGRLEELREAELVRAATGPALTGTVSTPGSPGMTRTWTEQGVELITRACSTAAILARLPWKVIGMVAGWVLGLVSLFLPETLADPLRQLLGWLMQGQTGS